MEILRDSIWQFVGAFLALVAILISIYVFRLQTKRKLLSYEIISSTNLLNIADNLAATIKDKIEVFVSGQPIKGLHLLVVQLINTGNIPISSQDYETPVSFIFTDSSIIDASVSGTNPPHIKALLESKNNTVSLKPILLNPGDIIEIKILLSTFNRLTVDGRIIGVKDITLINDVTVTDKDSTPMFITSVFAIVAIVAIPILLVINRFMLFPIELISYYIGLLSGILIISVTLQFSYLTENKHFYNIFNTHHS